MTQILHPRENPDLAGHEGAEREILDAWTSSRLHHAWLISGPKGIGKATLAYRFARFVLAGGNAPAAEDGAALFGAEEIPATPTSLAIDPEHPVFRRVAANGHADLQVIERGMSDDGKRMQTVIPVEKIRAVGHRMSLTAGLARYQRRRCGGNESECRKRPVEDTRRTAAPCPAVAGHPRAGTPAADDPVAVLPVKAVQPGARRRRGAAR